MDKEIEKKIESCKALQGMTVAELVSSPRYLQNLASYMTEQRETRKMAIASYQAMHKLGTPKSYKLPAHPVDRVINMSLEDFAVEYLKVVSRVSKRPLAERRYIEQLGRQPYQLTVAQIVVDEFPELEDVLIPKSNTN